VVNIKSGMSLDRAKRKVAEIIEASSKEAKRSPDRRAFATIRAGCGDGQIFRF